MAATFASLAAAVAAERARLLAMPADAGREREGRALVLDEILGSCALAGARLERHALVALVDRGLAVGDLPLRTYAVAAGYADAASRVAQARAPRLGEAYLRVEEVVELHGRATRFQPEARPGAWRTQTLPPLGSGMVPPPFWLVPRETAAFVDRYAAGPAATGSPLLWVAEAHERFERLRPFAAGNGRVGRLVANLLLRRLGLPPFIVAPPQGRHYVAALSRADAGDPWPLATMLARSVLAALQRLTGTRADDRDANSPLVGVAEIASGAERQALYKAIQRGRLRAVRQSGRLFTRASWLAEYRAAAR